MTLEKKPKRLLRHSLWYEDQAFDGACSVAVRVVFGRFRFLFYLWAALTVLALAQPVQATSVDEFRLKVAFMWKFLQFSDWRTDDGASVDQSSDRSWHICFTDADAHRGGQQLLEGKQFKDQLVELLLVSPEDSLALCHILFVSKGNSTQYDLSRVPDTVLTVGEHDTFIQQGGLIQFVVKQRRLRFRINREKIRQSKIRIDARVLRLAVNVEEGR